MAMLVITRWKMLFHLVSQNSESIIGSSPLTARCGEGHREGRGRDIDHGCSDGGREGSVEGTKGLRD